MNRGAKSLTAHYADNVVGRLIRSRQLAYPLGLPVYVARRPLAPFCETPSPNSLPADFICANPCLSVAKFFCLA